MTKAQRREPAKGPLLTMADVAGMLRVSNSTAHCLMRAGEFPELRVGTNYPIRESALKVLPAAGFMDSEKVSG